LLGNYLLIKTNFYFIGQTIDVRMLLKFKRTLFTNMSTISVYTQFFLQLACIAAGYLFYRKKSISLSGLLALIGISTVFIWLDLLLPLIVMAGMFASSSLLTGMGKKRKKNVSGIVEKSGPRDYIQAFANLGPAIVFIILFYFLGDWALLAAFIGSIAGANADSWASEIGGLSKQKPVLITTFKLVPKGISGGVTWLGTLGGIAGALFIVLLAFVCYWSIVPVKTLRLIILIAFVAGITGFILDSYLGAIGQGLYKSSTGQLQEYEESGAKLEKGYRWINNDMVNFLTTTMAGLIAALLYIFLK